MHQRSVWRIRSYKRSHTLAGAEKLDGAERRVQRSDRRPFGMAMGMRNEGIVATQTAQSLCRKTPNCHFLSHGEYHIGRDLVPTRAYAIPACMPCLQMSLDVLSD